MKLPDLEAHTELSPAACREVLKAVAFAEATLTHWGVRIPQQAAIQDAKRWLARLGERDNLDDLTDVELRKTSESAALAVDLYHITAALDDEPNVLVGAELAAVVRGPPSTTARVQDFIAQFWIGTLLAQSNLKPRIHVLNAPGMSLPDFYAEWGTLEFAVEVKCPKSVSSTRKAIDAAARQLRGKTQPGVIALDLTYALELDPFEVTREASPLRDRVHTAHRERHDQFMKYINVNRTSDKFARVAVLFTFARFWSWHIGSKAERDAGLVFISSAFPYACAGLITRQARGFQESLPSGVTQLTGNTPQVTRS
jgi:hypothetical protein